MREYNLFFVGSFLHLGNICWGDITIVYIICPTITDNLCFATLSKLLKSSTQKIKYIIALNTRVVTKFKKIMLANFSASSLAHSKNSLHVTF